MVQRKPPSAQAAREALAPVAAWLDDDTQPAPARPALADAVRTTARFLAAEHPGGAVELRVPPFVAVQCIEGLNHRRGTPPNVVEMSPRTWLQLATGRRTWDEVAAAGELTASGSRADLGDVLPVAALAG